MSNLGGLPEDDSIFMDVARLRVFCHNKFLDESDITSTQGMFILYISQNQGVTQGELAKIAGIRPVTLGGIIDRMEAKGWVERHADKEDRRAKRIWLTDSGKSLFNSIRSSLRKVNKIAQKGIDKQRFDDAMKVLGDVRRNLQSYKDDNDS